MLSPWAAVGTSAVGTSAARSCPVGAGGGYGAMGWALQAVGPLERRDVLRWGLSRRAASPPHSFLPC